MKQLNYSPHGAISYHRNRAFLLFPFSFFTPVHLLHARPFYYIHSSSTSPLDLSHSFGNAASQRLLSFRTTTLLVPKSSYLATYLLSLSLHSSQDAILFATLSLRGLPCQWLGRAS